MMTMSLREILDEVRFGNTSRLCVAMQGTEGNRLANFKEGKYWELPSGNWRDGSDSYAEPEIPEAIMAAQVVEVASAPNIRAIYSKLGKLSGNSCDTTIIVVAVPENDFDADAYWADNNVWGPVEGSAGLYEWAYNIKKTLWDEIRNMAPNAYALRNAIIAIPAYGLLCLKNQEDVEESLQLAQKIAKKVSNLSEVSALLELVDAASAFTDMPE